MSKRIASMIFCLLLAVAAGCHAKKSQDADSIAYAGAAVITENVFPQFLPMFVEKTGIKMAAIKTVGSQEAVKYVMDGRADVGGVAHKPWRDPAGQPRTVGRETRHTTQGSRNLTVRRISRPDATV